jgi:hypothetical protein
VSSAAIIEHAEPTEQRTSSTQRTLARRPLPKPAGADQTADCSAGESAAPVDVE